MAEVEEATEPKRLSLWWCDRHWRAFEHDPPAGQKACELMTTHLLTRKDFKQAVARIQRRYRVFNLNRARQAAVEEWSGRNADAPLCCLLGDEVLWRIYQRSGVRPL